MLVIGLAAAVIYRFFCPNDVFETAKMAELLVIAIVSAVFLFVYRPRNKVINCILAFFSLAAAPFYMAHFVLYDRSIRQTENYWTEILLIVLLMCFVFIFIRSTAAAVTLVSVSFAVFVVLNELLLCFRKAAITPTDIFSLKTAAAVSGQYKFVFTYKMLIAIVSAAAAGMVTIRVNEWPVFKKIKFALPLNFAFTLIPAAVVAAGLNYIGSTDIKDIDQFDVSLSNKNAGTVTTFANGVKTMMVEPPENYSLENAKEILDEYPPEENTDFEKPDVVVIMNEAFSDLSAFCGIGNAAEFMPNISAMNENIHKGYAQVSVFGGNTANTEFEFLTGNSLYFLPNGYIPYMRTITGDTHSLVSDFAEQGYKTTAIHPYMPQCWRRSSIYPLLGFDEFVSGPDFDKNHITDSSKMRGSVDFGDLKYIRKYISDEESFDKVLEKLDEEPDKNKFIFNVTMQNHGPYTYKDEDFLPYLENNGIYIDYYEDGDEVMQYLTLIKESDKAFAHLTEQLKMREKPTVVVMFGDHLPGLKAINESIKDKSAAEKQAKYTVPYFIWANYDIGTDINDDLVGMPYLANDLKKLIGMPMTDWDMLREAVRSEYPSLNAYGAFDTDGGWHPSADGPVVSDIMEKYKIAQYGHLFRGLKGEICR